MYREDIHRLTHINIECSLGLYATFDAIKELEMKFQGDHKNKKS